MMPVVSVSMLCARVFSSEVISAFILRFAAIWASRFGWASIVIFLTKTLVMMFQAAILQKRMYARKITGSAPPVSIRSSSTDPQGMPPPVALNSVSTAVCTDPNLRRSSSALGPPPAMVAESCCTRMIAKIRVMKKRRRKHQTIEDMDLTMPSISIFSSPTRCNVRNSLNALNILRRRKIQSEEMLASVAMPATASTMSTKFRVTTTRSNMFHSLSELQKNRTLYKYSLRLISVRKKAKKNSARTSPMPGGKSGSPRTPALAANIDCTAFSTMAHTIRSWILQSLRKRATHP
mmetsp:Transcript_39156/g.88204  ORF Transcript_39156/g.88204 Transcript_39156/m.88204 type:complete len:292 (-) Transcript_39156:497-1372(-)